ncbi:MAG: hypothetical protein ABR991_04445 [Terracidiphilus sp.]|jgi:hypothetical protein
MNCLWRIQNKNGANIHVHPDYAGRAPSLPEAACLDGHFLNIVRLLEPASGALRINKREGAPAAEVFTGGKRPDERLARP